MLLSSIPDNPSGAKIYTMAQISFPALVPSPQTVNQVSFPLLGSWSYKDQLWWTEVVTSYYNIS